MKKQLFSGISLLISALTSAQTSFVSDFENLGLSSGQYYDGSSGGGGFQASHAYFPTVWDTSWGGYWAGGWAASAVYDSSTAGPTNKYGCSAYKGYGNSNTFAVASAYSPVNIRLTDSLIGKTVSGFYVCNSTYTYKSIKYGDSFSRAFGDTTGTGCGCPQGSYPDWFKLTIKKYYGGTLQNDSVELYLADYRFSNNAQDYILNTWTWVNLTSLGNTDSLAFSLSSSDVGSWGMNTPAFFCLDNLTLLNVTGIYDAALVNELSLFPNPAQHDLELRFNAGAEVFTSVSIVDAMGREIDSQSLRSFAGENRLRFDVSHLAAGVYYVNLRSGEVSVTRKFVKQ